MLVAYASGHGFGHVTRLCEVLRAVRDRAPELPVTVVGAVPEWLVRPRVPGRVEFRPLACDVGLAQRDALLIDECATAALCRGFEATWEARIDAEVEFLRACRARVVLGDIPPLAFAAAARAGVESIALGNFTWDWIYLHLADRQPSLAESAARAARAYEQAGLLLELPFSGAFPAFPRRERVGLVARRPQVDGSEARRRLRLDARPAALVSFGGVGLPGLTREVLGRDPELQFVLPEDVGPGLLDALGLDYPDVVGAVDVVVTKPGYGIVSDAIGARTRVVYTERGDFPEYPVMVREMPRWLACAHVGNEDLRAGRIGEPIRQVLAQPLPPPVDLGGAERAAGHILEMLG